jgi:hypothetical protein
MAGIGQRGKGAEKEVRAFLERLNFKYAGFDYSRIYDARSAGGKFPSRPGDFEFYAPGLHGLVEVKEVAHHFRLPQKNLDKDQIAKLRKRQLAGGRIYVLINFTVTGLWVSVPIDWLHERAAQPSWDLSGFETYDSAADALYSLEMHLLAMKEEKERRSA